jgi:hypothetical protein
MNVELDLLEQILDEEWTLAAVVSFLEGYGKDAWQILAGQYADGYIQFWSDQCDVIPEWHVREIVRTRRPVGGVLIHCTEKGARLV